jgi:DNA-binding MarR family transcriptional regulator
LSTRKSATAPDPAPHDLGVLLALALGAFKARMHAHLAKLGYDDLGPSFGFVFRSLADRPLSLAELAARLGITSQGALKIAADMVDRGYVERMDDAADRRVRRLALTARGRNALRAARRFHAASERELAETLGATRLNAGRAMLEAMITAPSIEGAWAEAARPF